MSVHLYTEAFAEALARKATPPEMKRGEALLRDAARCGEAIAALQGGSPLPHFARVRADLKGMESLLPSYAPFKYVVIVGNGGSIRNSAALYKALFKGRASRKLRLLDGTDPSGLFGALLRRGGPMTPQNTLLLPVSKSGETENVIQETRRLLDAGFPALVVTTGKPNTLASLAASRGLPLFPHPDEVGGRFTAAQNNSLLPLALVEGKMDKVRAIASAFERAYSRLAPDVPPEENAAKTLALLLFRAELAGYTEVFLPIYSKALSGFGELVVQLAHESLCKGGKGQSFLFAEAPESQHHTNQRYFGGRATMAGLTVRVGGFAEDPELAPGVSSGAFLDLEHAGVVEEARKEGIPHLVLSLDGLTPEDVAGAIALFQYAVVYGGLLRGVNPFDQPAVEGSKETTMALFRDFGEKVRRQAARYSAEASHHL